MTLYDDVINVAKPFLGPATERFVNRQINGHLDIETYQLTSQHLEELARWCYVSGKLVISDEKAKGLSDKVKSLRS